MPGQVRRVVTSFRLAGLERQVKIELGSSPNLTSRPADRHGGMVRMRARIGVIYPKDCGSNPGHVHML